MPLLRGVQKLCQLPRHLGYLTAPTQQQFGLRGFALRHGPRIDMASALILYCYGSGAGRPVRKQNIGRRDPRAVR